MFLLYLGWVLVVIGIFFIITSIVGLFRMRNIYNKMHAASLSDSFGLPICLLGFVLIQDNLVSMIKICIMLFFFFVLSPTNSHSLISAVWQQNQKQTREKNDGF